MGDRIRNLRRKKHLTRRYVAEHTGVTAFRVMLWEINLSVPDEDTLIRIANVLGVPLRELTGGKARQAPNASAFTKTLENSPLQEHLQEGEKLLWWGKPVSSAVFSGADFVNIPITLAILVFSLYFTYMSFRVNLFATVCGGLMSLVGIYLAVFRFFRKYAMKKKTYYGVSEQRILFYYDGGKKRFHAIAYNEIEDILITLGKQYGTLYFKVKGSIATTRGYSQRIDNTGVACDVGNANAFFDIPNASRVLSIIEERRQRAKTDG